MEDRPPFLLAVLILYFLLGATFIFSGVFNLLRGVTFIVLAPYMALAVGMMASSVAAWKRRRWGYLGVLLAGLYFVVHNFQRRAQAPLG